MHYEMLNDKPLKHYLTIEISDDGSSKTVFVYSTIHKNKCYTVPFTYHSVWTDSEILHDSNLIMSAERKNYVCTLQDKKYHGSAFSDGDVISAVRVRDELLNIIPVSIKKPDTIGYLIPNDTIWKMLPVNGRLWGWKEID